MRQNIALQMVSDDKEQPHIFTDEEIVKTVDFAITAMDKNTDGFIEFPEFSFGIKNYN